MNISQINKFMGVGNKHFFGAVSTYKDLREETDYVIDIFYTAIKEFTNDVIKPRDFSLNFENGSFKRVKFTEKNYEKIKDILKNKQLESLVLDFSEQESINDSFIRIDASVQVVICRKQLFEKDSEIKFSKNQVEFSVSVKYYSEKFEFLKRWIKEIFVKIEGINGYMDCLLSKQLCGCLTSTAYEDITTLNATGFGDYINKLRGYFWLSILTEKHIKKLGGEEYVKANFPGYQISEVRMKDGSKTLFCQLTNNILTFDKQEYKKLREFLDPLLDKEDMIYEAFYYKERNSIDDRRLVLSEELYYELKVMKMKDREELSNGMTERIREEIESIKNG